MPTSLCAWKVRGGGQERNRTADASFFRANLGNLLPFRRHWTVTVLTGFSQNRAETNGFRQYILDGTIYYRF